MPDMSERQMLQLETLLTKFIWQTTPRIRIATRTVITSLRQKRAQQRRRGRERDAWERDA